MAAGVAGGEDGGNCGGSGNGKGKDTRCVTSEIEGKLVRGNPKRTAVPLETMPSKTRAWISRAISGESEAVLMDTCRTALPD